MIPNSDFENGTPFCGIMSGPTDFNNALDSWYTPSAATGDVYYTEGIDDDCYNFQPANNYPGPIGIKGSELPHSGNTFVGIRSYSLANFEQREYMQNVLTEPTVIGQTYILSCWISAADSVESFSNNQCFHLSTEPIMSTNDLVIELTPTSYSEDVIDTTDGWILYTDTLVSEDEYIFITVGNFFTDAETTLAPNPNSNTQPGNYGAYYFYDDIRLELHNDVSVNKEVHPHEITLYPSPATDMIFLRGPEQPFSYSISNMLGHAIHQGNCESGTCEVSAVDLEPGVYVVHVMVNDQLEMLRFVKR